MGAESGFDCEALTADVDELKRYTDCARRPGAAKQEHNTRIQQNRSIKTLSLELIYGCAPALDGWAVFKE